MPGNELGDRVHNFFVQDNSSQEQHQSHVGNWPGLNNNFWVGSQRQIDVLNSSSKGYSSLNSETTDRGQVSYPVQPTHGLNISQSNLRPDFSKSQSLNEQQYSNGFMLANQFYQTRQNEANFLAVDSDSEQRHLVASRGLPAHELQPMSDQGLQAKPSDRSETSGFPGSFDLFGGQQQMSHQQASMLQALQRQQSGLNDMQQFQQQLMIRKMQELQRQQQLRHLDVMPQNLINQVSPFTKEAFDGQSSNLVNGPPNSDALQYPWTVEPGTNWLSRGSSAMQVSPGGLVFSPNLGQTQRLVDVLPQQVDQSLYGVPVSSSRGLAVNQYSQMVMTDRPSMLQMTTSSNSPHGSQHNCLPDQIDGQEGTSIFRQKIHKVNTGYASSHSLNTGIMDTGGLQQVNSMKTNAPQQDFPGRQVLAARSETLHERSTVQYSESRNEVALDPTEEKILYGSDDNIWAAFGNSPDMSGEAGNLFDNGGSSNGFPAVQSGSWSALMQSAVAETSSSDVRAQKEWNDVNFHNPGASSANNPHSTHDNNVKPDPMPNENMGIASALTSGSSPRSDNANTLNVMGLNQLGNKFHSETCRRMPTATSQRFEQSLEEAREWSNRIPLQKSVAEESQIYGNASQHSFDVERNAKTISATWAPGQIGIRQSPNGWNALAAGPPGGDRILNIHEADNFSQNSQNNQGSVMQGEMIHASSLRKSNSVTSSAIEFGPIQSTIGNHQQYKGALSLNDATDSVANSCNRGVDDATNAFVKVQWKNVYPRAKVQGGEGLGRMLDQVNEYNQGLKLNCSDKDEATRHDMENCAMKENSNDSHHSNLSHHTSGGFRENGLLDAGDTRSQLSGKQKSTNQIGNKVSVHQFQYHPMGNLDEDVDPTYGLKQSTQVQITSPQITHFSQSKVFGHISRNGRETEKGEPPKDDKGPEQKPSRGSFPGYAPNMSVPFSRSSDSYINEASSPSQNMLELLHKVDQSRDLGAMMHLSSSGCNVSTQLPEAETVDESRLWHSQSSVSQGFGLQLGPPSQRLDIPDLSSPSQNALGTVSSMRTVHVGADLQEKGMLMVPTSSVQSLPLPNKESQIEFGNDRSAGLGQPGNGNSQYKAPGNYHPAFSSGTPYARSQIQNKTTKVSGKVAMDQHMDSFISSNTSHPMQGGSAETVLPDISHNIQNNNLASSGGMAQQNGPYDVQERGSAATASTRSQMRSPQHFGISGITRQAASSQVLHNMWKNVPATRHTLAKAPSLSSEIPQPNILESNSQGNLAFSKGLHLSSELTAVDANSPGVFDGEEPRLKENSEQLASISNIDSAPDMEESLGKASSIKNHLDDSPANSASTQKDTDPFGRSLKPNAFSNKTYALLNQMRVLKDAETDPSIRISKRMKGPDNVLDVRQVNLMAGPQNEVNVGDSLGSSTGVPSENRRMLSFSTPADILQRNTSPHGNITSQDIVVAGLDASSSNPSTDGDTTVRVEHHNVSPQMALSWFNQYGSLKDGQMMPMFNAQKFTPLRPEEPPFTLENSSSVLDAPNLEEKSTAVPFDACRVGSTLINSSPTSEANVQILSSQSMQLNVTGQNQVVLVPKKRKSATSELLPWYKEISDGSQSLSILSVAEAYWNKAANSLTEKVADVAELIEDGPVVLRSKRRLVLTTQLIQQLFHPPPTTSLSVDARSKYECVTYAVSRVALGDACRAVSRSSVLGLPRDGIYLHSIKGKLNGDPHFAKVIEELLGKARKLEKDFSRLDKSASILDLRLECQDLEKFRVINRFAKFHGRGQTDNAETSSIHGTATIQKPCAQRYVTAVPLPRSLPDRVQCLSL